MSTDKFMYGAMLVAGLFLIGGGFWYLYRTLQVKPAKSKETLSRMGWVKFEEKVNTEESIKFVFGASSPHVAVWFLLEQKMISMMTWSTERKAYIFINICTDDFLEFFPKIQIKTSVRQMLRSLLENLAGSSQRHVLILARDDPEVAEFKKKVEEV